MSEHELHTPEHLSLRRRARRRTTVRRQRVAAVVVAAVVAAGVGVLAGGGHAPRSARAAPNAARAGLAPPAPKPKPNPGPTEAQREQRAITAVEQRMPFVALAGKAHREIALTFDDGPGPYTPSVVHTLKRLNAPATFFQVGFSEHWFTRGEEDEVGDPAIAIGDHTQTHPHLDTLDAAKQAAQIDGDAAVLTGGGAPYPRLFRPPYGAYDRTTEALLEQRRMLMVLWTVDSGDYAQPGVEAIVHNVLAGAQPGAIVLLHDAGGDRTETIAALPRIVHALRARHYRLVTVPRLLADAPPPLRQPAHTVGAG